MGNLGIFIALSSHDLDWEPVVYVNYNRSSGKCVQREDPFTRDMTVLIRHWMAVFMLDTVCRNPGVRYSSEIFFYIPLETCQNTNHTLEQSSNMHYGMMLFWVCPV